MHSRAQAKPESRRDLAQSLTALGAAKASGPSARWAAAARRGVESGLKDPQGPRLSTSNGHDTKKERDKA